MAEIEFKRVERKCDYNTRIREGHSDGHLLYDWDVLIDGERRAQFRPGVYKGYNLHDADGWPIKKANDYGPFARRSDVAAQAGFESKIRSCLERSLIPTIDQLAEARAERQRQHEALEAATAEADRLERVREAAPEMLEALQEIARMGSHAAGRLARAAIAKATGA